jgi:tetratricopeptide (TPR) repeat protein
LNEEKEYQELLEVTEPSAQSTGIARLAALYILQGRFNKAKDQFKQDIEHADNVGEKAWKSSSHLLLAALYLKTGNPENALNEIENAWTIAHEEELLDDKRMALVRKTLAYIEMKLLDDAQRVTDELEDSIRKGKNQKLLRYLSLLKGMTELERGNYSSAIEEFKKASSLLPFQNDAIFGENHAIFLDPLALAYYKAEDLETARDEYKRITKLTIGRLWDGDIYARSFYMLGKIYEQQGDKTKAIEHYEKFLDLWKNADPGMAEVEDAKKRLAGLRVN